MFCKVFLMETAENPTLGAHQRLVKLSKVMPCRPFFGTLSASCVQAIDYYWRQQAAPSATAAWHENPGFSDHTQP